MVQFLFIAIKLYPVDTITPPSTIQKKSVVFYVSKKYSIHAEQSCIMNCRNKHVLRKSKIILVKLSKDGHVQKCEPCFKCCHIINKYKICRVISFDN